MTEVQKSPAKPQKKIILAIVLITAVAFVLVDSCCCQPKFDHPAHATVDADSYADEVAAALDGADASIGKALIAESDCATCHLTGDGSTAPFFDGIGSLAAQRRPPLGAEQYLYEAILFPAVHLLEGYTNAMPNDYGETAFTTALGHMIAYLLTLTEENASFLAWFFRRCGLLCFRKI